MNVMKTIDNLYRFDDNIACAYEECPIYRTELQACKDGEEVCKCFHEAIGVLRQYKFAKWKLHKDGSATCGNCNTTQQNVWDWDNYQKYCGYCGAEMGV